jgi:hypothetical protein
MALLSRITCGTCGKEADVWHSPSDPKPRICHACRDTAAAEKREDALAAVAALPIEERLRRIEAWIYDYRAPVPLIEMRF